MAARHGFRGIFSASPDCHASALRRLSFVCFLRPDAEKAATAIFAAASHISAVSAPSAAISLRAASRYFTAFQMRLMSSLCAFNRLFSFADIAAGSRFFVPGTASAEYFFEISFRKSRTPFSPPHYAAFLFTIRFDERRLRQCLLYTPFSLPRAFTSRELDFARRCHFLDFIILPGIALRR